MRARSHSTFFRMTWVLNRISSYGWKFRLGLTFVSTKYNSEIKGRGHNKCFKLLRGKRTLASPWKHFFFALSLIQHCLQVDFVLPLVKTVLLRVDVACFVFSAWRGRYNTQSYSTFFPPIVSPGIVSFPSWSSPHLDVPSIKHLAMCFIGHAAVVSVFPLHQPIEQAPPFLKKASPLHFECVLPPNV